tara:strand:- start:503 stop:1120 length:618 start_codon:yes stop_codon:yes gene_type:complete
MSNIKKTTELNNYIGRKTKESLNFPLCFVLLGILTKNYSKFGVYTEMTHRDIADKVNELFKDLLNLKGWNTNEKELDLKVRIELYKLRELEVVKFIPRKKKDTYAIKATERANELLLFLYALLKKGEVDELNKKFIDNSIDAKIKLKRKQNLSLEDYLVEDSEGNKIDIRDVPMNILPHHTDEHLIEINFTNKKGTTNPEFKKYE